MAKGMLVQTEQRTHPQRATKNRRIQPRVKEQESPLATVQNHLGNAAIQRLLAQRSSNNGGDGAFDLDNETASRINRSRGGGQPLDGAVQKQMGASLGSDFSSVRVHTGSESHQLNEQMNAKAFTTGSDIFFREGAYSPQSSSGQELIAHELTHVVQQNSGAVGGGSNAMRVNAPGDRFEQEADAMSKSVTSSAAAPAVQRATDEEMPPTTETPAREDELALQKQEMPEEKKDEIA